MVQHVRVRSNGSTDTVDITDEVAKAVSGNGSVVVTAQHTTCALAVNEHTDGSVAEDIHGALSDAYPRGASYKHDRVDGNAHAHIRAAVIGPTITLPVEDSTVCLGRWQRILLFEFDGPRERHVILRCSQD